MAIRLTHLRYFVVVAEEGQITRAAAKLHIAQPALSQAIAALESELGFAVLERHARGVKLTPAGERFLAKAQAALGAEIDAIQTAQWLSRMASGTIEFGFVGAPPGLDSPGFLGRFSEAHPDIDVRYRELAFPGQSTSSWLAEVDLAASHIPPADEAVWTQFVRTEPRVVLAPAGHPLAERSHLNVADVLEETFIGYHPSVDRQWAGFWSLDDHRGGPPSQLTPDRASVPQEVLAALAVRSAITTVPSSAAAVLVNVLAGITAIPLVDADPTTFVIAGRIDRINALVSSFREFSSQAVSGPAQPADVQRARRGPTGAGP
jgi:DNA-binding transcriptional LysR family regulator